MKISLKKIMFYVILFLIVQAVFIFLKKDLQNIRIFNTELTYSSKGIIVFFGLLIVDLINSTIRKRKRVQKQNH